MGQFALGAAAGSIVGNVAHMAWDSARAASTSPIKAPDFDTVDGGGVGELETLKSIKGLKAMLTRAMAVTTLLVSSCMRTAIT